MTRHTLYAYVCDSDLDYLANDLLDEFDRFVEGREWTCDDPHIVNQRRLGDPSLRPGDLPDWDLGMNVALPDPGHETPGWYSDVIAIAEFLAALNINYNREFAMGIGDRQTGISEDLHYIRSKDAGLDRLREIIGVGAIE